MTIREFIEGCVRMHGISKDDVKTIVDRYSETDAGEKMKDKLTRPVEGYPENLLAYVLTQVDRETVRFLQEKTSSVETSRSS